MKRLINKLKGLLLSTIVVTPIVISNTALVVRAEDPANSDYTKITDTPANTNARQVSMMKYFAGERGGTLDIENLQPLELRTFGILLSNYFNLGHTTIGTIPNASKDLAYNLTLGDKSDMVYGLTKGVQDLVKSTASRGLLVDESNNPINGEQFLEIMGNKKTIKTQEGKETIKFSNDAFRAAFKAAFNTNASNFVSESGLQGVTELRVDTFGNIWGKRGEITDQPTEKKEEKKEETNQENKEQQDPEQPPETPQASQLQGMTDVKDLDSYILIMPACLNPASYVPNEQSGTFRLPMNNLYIRQQLATTNEVTRAMKQAMDGEFYKIQNIPAILQENRPTSNGMIFGMYSPYRNLSTATPKVALSIYNNQEESPDSLFKRLIETPATIDENKENYEHFSTVVVSGNTQKTLIEAFDKEKPKHWWGTSGLKEDKKTTLTNLVKYLGTDVSLLKHQTNSIRYIYNADNDNQFIKQQMKQIATDNTLNTIDIYGMDIFDPYTTQGNSKQIRPNFFVKSKHYQEFTEKHIKNTDDHDGLGKIFMGENAQTVKGLQTNNKYWINIFPDRVGIMGMIPEPLSWSVNLGKFTKSSPFYYSTMAKYNTMDGKSLLDSDLSVADIIFLNRIYTEYILFGTSEEVSKLKGNKDLLGVETLSMYLSTLIELGINVNKDGKIDAINFIPAHLPEIKDDELKSARKTVGDNAGGNQSDELELKKLRKDMLEITPKLKDLLSTKIGNFFRMRWIKAFMADTALSLHQAITGTEGNKKNITNNGEIYNSNVGMTYTPSIKEIPVIKWFVNNFTSYYVIVMLFCIAISLILLLTGVRGLLETLTIVGIVSICSFFPNIIMDNIITTNNKAAEKVFSDRFDFWAITRNDDYVKDDIVLINSISDVYERQKRLGEDAFSDYGVRLKWMAPKKRNVASNLFNKSKVTNDFILNTNLFKYLFSNFLFGEEYVNNGISRYLYRPYNQITKEGIVAYQKRLEAEVNGITMTARDLVSLGKEADENREGVIPEGQEALKFYQKKFESALLYEDIQNINSLDSTEIRILNPKIYQDLKQAGQNVRNNGNEARELNFHNKIPFWGLNNLNINKQIVKDGRKITKNDDIDFGLKSFDTQEIDEDVAGTVVVDPVDPEEEWFLKLTESPYYYFYANLKANYTRGGSFKKALLEEDLWNVDHFTNPYDETEYFSDQVIDAGIMGATRDFLNLEGLFSVVIPYFQLTNQMVIDYTNKYGTDIPTFDFENLDIDGNYKDKAKQQKQQIMEEERFAPDTVEPEATEQIGFKRYLITEVYAEELKTPEEKEEYKNFYDKQQSELEKLYKQQQKHKANMEQLWAIYNPWVDSLTTAYYNTKADKTRTVKHSQHQINPSTYIDKNKRDSRLMIFSEADQRAKGYENPELTDVERRIKKVLASTRKDLLYLVNYYDMEDETLLSAAAMYATFNFNREFSTIDIKSDKQQLETVLYPQGFELRTFNFDAYMRMILLNATGETDTMAEGLYEKILMKSSFITGLLLVIGDILGVIVIPAMKMLVICGLYVVILCIIMTMVLFGEAKVVKRTVVSFILPVSRFLFLNGCFYILIATLLGSGLANYVGSKTPRMEIGDPTVTLLMFNTLCISYIIFMWKILGEVFTTLKDLVIDLFNTITDLLKSAAHAIANGVKMLSAGGIGYAVGYRLGKRLESWGEEKLKTTENKTTSTNKTTTTKGKGKGKGGEDSPETPNRTPEKPTTSLKQKPTKETKKEKEKVKNEINEKANTYQDPNKKKETVNKQPKTPENKDYKKANFSEKIINTEKDNVKTNKQKPKQSKDIINKFDKKKK